RRTARVAAAVRQRRLRRDGARLHPERCQWCLLTLHLRPPQRSHGTQNTKHSRTSPHAASRLRVLGTKSGFSHPASTGPGESEHSRDDHRNARHRSPRHATPGEGQKDGECAEHARPAVGWYVRWQWIARRRDDYGKSTPPGADQEWSRKRLGSAWEGMAARKSTGRYGSPLPLGTAAPEEIERTPLFKGRHRASSSECRDCVCEVHLLLTREMLSYHGLIIWKIRI